MRLAPIVAALRARCPTFEDRVFGIGEYSAIDESIPERPVAFVLPLDEQIKSIANGGSVIRAEIYERVGIIVVQDTQDHQGLESYDALHDIRTELWRALFGWADDADAGPFIPDGGEPVDLNRTTYTYQFDFARTIAATSEEDGYQPEFDDFTGVGIRVDAIDPADPNLASPGPDGRVEIGADVPVEPPA